MHKIKGNYPSLLKAEAYLEPSQRFKMELFWENSELLKAVKYFCKSALLQIYECVPNAHLERILE